MVKPTRFYKREKPEKDEIVRIIMGEMKKDTVTCHLVDYNLSGILPITELTKKKRFNKRRGTIRSYYIPNKIIGASVMDISQDNIFLSRKFINENQEEADELDKNNNNMISFINQLTHQLIKDKLNQRYNDLLEKIVKPIEEITDKNRIINYMVNNLNYIKTLVDQDSFLIIKELLEKFNSNNLESFIRVLNQKLNVDFLQKEFDNYWKKIVYPIMAVYQEKNILQYLINNNDIIKNKVTEEEFKEIVILLESYAEIIKKNLKIKKEQLTFQLVSPKGITLIKNLIQETKNQYSNFDIYYDSAPNYIITVKDSINNTDDINYMKMILNHIQEKINTNENYKNCFIKIN